MDINEIKTTENLSEIAKFIEKDWINIYFGAKPYLDAMKQIESINDNFGLDSADSIIRYFLGNASTYRGENARIIKAKLNKLIR